MNPIIVLAIIIIWLYILSVTKRAKLHAWSFMWGSLGLFVIMKMNDDNKTVAAMDCLVPGIGEIIGGSQREDDYDKLVERMNECGLDKKDYEFYLDLRKYGTARHAGFGLGFERCVMYLTGMQNIRDVIPFPRTVNNCDL